MKTYRMAACGLALFAGSALASWASAGLLLPAAASGAQVTIDDFQFAPTPLTVAPGTQVTWVNKDGEPHTVVSADGAVPLKSPGLDTDDKFSFVFAQPGTYRYFCSVHPRMTGTVVVK